ncbi:hypothetical protein GOP47_0024389 [Adiantum capillus-veneris]|uniref:Uncharacterized protein n=1 Tax=Adiantum capillus-veneris TaxID=13818 RepID=A0A9D4U401_ADICA|nr:hypothetical protein GOP47_0024389 [Adiantum capillus-veneris]
MPVIAHQAAILHPLAWLSGTPNFMTRIKEPEFEHAHKILLLNLVSGSLSKKVPAGFCISPSVKVAGWRAGDPRPASSANSRAESLPQPTD